MVRKRTSSVNKQVDRETRNLIIRDLLDPPTDAPDVLAAYKKYDLQAKGVSQSSFYRWANYIGLLYRNQRIKELADRVVGEDLGTKPASLIRTRLFEALTSEECNISDLLRLAQADNLVSKTRLAETELRAKQRQLAAAIAAAERTEIDDPAKALANLKDNLRMIYGIGGEA